jgi:hypothetical protein
MSTTAHSSSKLRVGSFFLLQAVCWFAWWRSTVDQSPYFVVWLAAAGVLVIWCIAFFKRERALSRFGLLTVAAMPLLRLWVAGS